MLRAIESNGISKDNFICKTMISESQPSSSSLTEQPYKVAIVGAGLVGSLAALYFARRGWHVDVYEARRDLRTNPYHEGRSINLALSVRGIAAMERVGAAEEVMKWVVPMKGRMIHLQDAKQVSQAYSITGEVGR